MKFKLLIIQLLSTEYLIVPIKILFFLNYLLTNQDISFLKLVMVISVLVLEIPSGYFADKFSNKFVVYVSKIAFIIAMILYVCFPNLISFIISNILIGAASAFESGAQNTYFIQLCKKDNEDYKEILLLSEKGMYVVSFILTFMSSWLFYLNKTLPFIVTAIFFLITIILLWTLPPEDKQVSTNDDENNVCVVNFNLLKKILINKNLICEIILFTIISSLLISNFDYYALFLKKQNINTQFYGVIYSSFMILNYIGVYLFGKYKYGRNDFWLLMTIPISFLLVTSYNVLFLMFGIIFQQIMFAYYNVKFKIFVVSQIDDMKTSSQFQSMISFINSLVRIGILAIITILFNYYDLQAMMIMFAVITFIVIALFTNIKSHVNKEKKLEEL